MDCNEMRARTVNIFKNKAKSTQQEIAEGQEWEFLTLAAAVGEGRGK